MTKIFISYRREDSEDISGRIYDRLKDAFGVDNVFFDIDAIPLGVDFKKYIDMSVSQCEVFLVIIGRAWVDSRDKLGTIRLKSENDLVRLEIEAALKRKIAIIPVLVSGSSMPNSSQIPTSISGLVSYNGTQIRAGKDFHQDLNILIAEIRKYINSDYSDREAGVFSRVSQFLISRKYYFALPLIGVMIGFFFFQKPISELVFNYIDGIMNPNKLESSNNPIYEKSAEEEVLYKYLNALSEGNSVTASNLVSDYSLDWHRQTREYLRTQYQLQYDKRQGEPFRYDKVAGKNILLDSKLIRLSLVLHFKNNPNPQTDSTPFNPQERSYTLILEDGVNWKVNEFNLVDYRLMNNDYLADEMSGLSVKPVQVERYNNELLVSFAMRSESSDGYTWKSDQNGGCIINGITYKSKLKDKKLRFKGFFEKYPTQCYLPEMIDTEKEMKFENVYWAPRFEMKYNLSSNP